MRLERLQRTTMVEGAQGPVDDGRCTPPAAAARPRRNWPVGLTIDTDEGSQPAASELGSECLNIERLSPATAGGMCDPLLRLLTTPKNCINSARRALFTAPCEDDGEKKLWMRLELRLGLQTLVGGVGNGRLGGLITALRRGVARTLDLEPALVEVRELYEASKDTLTVVECVVSVPASRGRLDLAATASDIMDQCERNRVRVDDPEDLMKLISHVDVKDHGASRQQWGFAQVVLVAAIVASFAHYYGVFAFGAGAPVLGLRGGTQSLMGLRGPASAPHLAQAPQARRVQDGPLQVAMLDPMTISTLVLGAADSVASEKLTSRRTAAMARRASKSAGETCKALAADPVQGTQTMVRSLASQALLSADEDERPVQHTLMEDASEQVIDMLDKVAIQASSHATTIHKAANIVVKACHALDTFAVHHPASVGLASVALIAGVVVSQLGGTNNNQQ